MKKGDAGIAAFVALHVVCCGGLLLLATGVLSLGGIAAWFGSGAARLAGIAILSVATLAILLLLARRGGFRVSANKPGEAGLDR